MKLSEFKSSLSEVTQLKLVLPNGISVPDHFHVTELALISKNFTDCGGVARVERKVTFQLWVANDFYHRLTSFKGITKDFDERACTRNFLALKTHTAGI